MSKLLLRLFQKEFKQGILKKNVIFDEKRTDYFQNPEFINYDIILNTRRFDRNQFLYRSSIFHHFDQEIIGKPHFLPYIKILLIDNAIPLLFLLFLTDYRNYDKLVLFHQFDLENTFIIEQFLQQYQSMLLLAFSKRHDKFFNHVIQFYQILLELAMTESEIRIESFLLNNYIFPCHLADFYQYKIATIGLHPDTLQVTYELQKMSFPKLYLLNKNPNMLIHPNEFEDLIERSLKKQINHFQFLSDFNRMLWKMDTHPDNMLDEPKISKVAVKAFTTRQLLKQIICLLLPNWFEVWTWLDYPRSREIQRRLYFIKYQRKWMPPIKDYIHSILEI